MFLLLSENSRDRSWLQKPHQRSCEKDKAEEKYLIKYETYLLLFDLSVYF